jgi:hypothetical protein
LGGVYTRKQQQISRVLQKPLRNQRFLHGKITAQKDKDMELIEHVFSIQSEIALLMARGNKNEDDLRKLGELVHTCEMMLEEFRCEIGNELS